MHPEVLPNTEKNLLKKIACLSQVYQWVLAGGTACALHLGHRISRDLDFFTNKTFSTDKLFEDLKKLAANLVIESQSEAGLVAWINNSKFSAFYQSYLFVEPCADFMGAPVAGLADLAAMKLIAISQRGKKRDFVDLYFILQKVPSLKVANVLVSRYGREKINPLHIGKSLVYFADAEGDPEPEFLPPCKVSWTIVKKFFKSHVRQIVLDIEAILS